MHIIYIFTLYKYIHCFSRPKGSSSEASPALSRHSAHSELVIPGWAKKQGSWQALTEAEKKHVRLFGDFVAFKCFFDQKNENVRLLDDSVLTELAKGSAK